MKLTEKVKKLGPEGLAKFVDLVQELCPKAKSDLDAKRLQIKVDDIEKEAFLKISSLLDTLVGQAETVAEPPNKKSKAK